MLHPSKTRPGILVDLIMDYPNNAPEPVPEGANQPPTGRRRRKGYSECWRPAWTVALLTTIVFVVQFGLTLSDIPSTSIISNWICIMYHDNSHVPTSGFPLDCKGTDIQQDLNKISTVSLAVGSLARKCASSFLIQRRVYYADHSLEILTALLYGSVADCCGRK
jgi:hypothetical protein